MRNHLTSFAKKGEQLFCEAWKAASKPIVSLSSSNSCERPLCPAGIFALAGLPCGVCVMVKVLELSHEKADELRRIGIREGSCISLVRRDDPFLVSVDNSRVAIAQELALHIKVQSLPAETPARS